MHTVHSFLLGVRRGTNRHQITLLKCCVELHRVDETFLSDCVRIGPINVHSDREEIFFGDGEFDGFCVLDDSRWFVCPESLLEHRPHQRHIETVHFSSLPVIDIVHIHSNLEDNSSLTEFAAEDLPHNRVIREVAHHCHPVGLVLPRDWVVVPSCYVDYSETSFAHVPHQMRRRLRSLGSNYSSIFLEDWSEREVTECDGVSLEATQQLEIRGVAQQSFGKDVMDP